MNHLLELFDECDTNKDNRIDFNEWEQMAKAIKKKFPLAESQFSEIKQIFDDYDTDKDGLLGLNEIAEMFLKISNKITTLPPVRLIVFERRGVSFAAETDLPPSSFILFPSPTPSAPTSPRPPAFYYISDFPSVVLPLASFRRPACPQTAQVANQQGVYLAKKFNALTNAAVNLANNDISINNDELYYKPFRYLHLGSLASLGSAGAAFDLDGVGSFAGGLIAMYAWRSIYWSEQTSFRTRALLMVDWVSSCCAEANGRTRVALRSDPPDLRWSADSMRAMTFAHRSSAVSLAEICRG